MHRLALLLLCSSLATACSATADLQGVQPGSSTSTTGAHDAPGSTTPATPAPPTTTPAAPSEPGATPTTPSDSPVPGIKGKLAPPAASGCITNSDASQGPLQTEDEAKMAGGAGLTQRTQSAKERKGGLDRALFHTSRDLLSRGVTLQPITTRSAGGRHGLSGATDSDGDCLSDDAEAARGTDPHNPDSDGDGWFDGACNERRQLVLESVHVGESQDWSWIGGDDFYVIADDVRFPHGDFDGYWQGWQNGSDHVIGQTIAQRTRGTQPTALQQVTLEGYDDDFEIFNAWVVDDLLFRSTVDLGAFGDGETFTKSYHTDDYDYSVTFRVNVEHFADPEPLVDGDSDHDGIKDSAEARVAVDFGGITDPTKPDVLVEVDWMPEHALRTEAKYQVATRLAMHGIHLFILRDEEIALDDCVTVKEGQAIYNEHFNSLSYDAFRYALIGEQIWNDASGVAWGDMFFVDDSTWWIGNMVQPQAGTFIHELGHTLGLTKELFPMIDSISWLSYDSAMNYTFQALLVDYDSDGEPGDSWRHNDWASVDAGHALKWSFALVNQDIVGICK